MSKKILLISQHFYPEIGSAGNRLTTLFLLLKEQGYKVEVITSEPAYPNFLLYNKKEFWDDHKLNNSTEIHRIKVQNAKYSKNFFNRLIYYLKFTFKMIFYILFQLKKKHYDYVFVSSPPIFVAIVGIIAKYRFRSTLITDIRDLWPESLKGVGVFNYSFIIHFFEWIEKRIYNSSAKIIINSQGFQKHITCKFNIGKEKLLFIPNAARKFEIQTNIDKKSRTDETFKVIYAGNIGMAQDVETLKRLTLILNSYPIKFSVIGYGVKKLEFAKYVKEHEVKNVTFYNPLTRKECLKLIRMHSVGISTLSNNDVFETVLPGKVIDYLTCGLPVAASVSGYTKHIVETEKVGLVAKSHNAEDLAEIILYMYKNPQEHASMVENATKFIIRRFMWEENVEVLYQFLDGKSEKIE